MREILFRGKDTDGVWHEGFYCVLNDKSHRIYTGYAEIDCGTYYPDFCTVIPESIGQYTGLTDKNGTRIFEHDIVRRTCVNKNFDYIVKYNNNLAEFELDFIKTDSCLAMFHSVAGEVIGNIHDNPELLKGGAEE